MAVKTDYVPSGLMLTYIRSLLIGIRGIEREHANGRDIVLQPYFFTKLCASFVLGRPVSTLSR